MSQHTPGPWYAIRNGVTGQAQVRKDIGDTSYMVAALSDWSEETEANAEVIAAAPDLLDELRFAHQIIRNALNLMTTEQKVEWAKHNELDGVIGEGVTRANERESVITRAEGRS